MLSILIPTYNYNITGLVESLSNQLKNVSFPFEVLILDDCSPNSEITEANKSIEKSANCYYLQNTVNKGRTATRQALAERAQFDYLLFMDADVLPGNEDFIKKFKVENQTADVVFGGISYENKKPESDKILRWKYGKAREAKPVSEREKMPYLSIISQCFLIKKSVFLKANDFHENVYGVDVLFAQNLEKMQVAVLHINNPIVHLGLESSESFIRKTEKGLKSLYQFEKENKIPDDYRPIQKAYQTLKKNGALNLFIKTIKTFEKSILKNLKSSSPSLFLFDLYRLYYFATLNLEP
ncbi:MAG: glycosyltransferase [Flavobacteriaceae bacterium]|nr:glycosyltransferase [Flavobacteriaceae bacterium]